MTTLHTREDLLVRLARIEGQVRGLSRMVAADRYCIDVLTQVASVNAALQAVATGLLDDHLRHCVLDAARTDADTAEVKLTEATTAITRLLRA